MTTSKRYHSSWLIGFGSLGVLVGVVLSAYTSAEYFSGIEWLVVATSLAVVSVINRRFAALILLLIGGVSLGLWRGSNVIVKISEYDNLYGQQVIVQGRVAEDPSLANDGDIQLRLKEVIVDDAQMTGQLWVNSPDRVEIRRSDVVTVRGQLSKVLVTYQHLYIELQYLRLFGKTIQTLDEMRVIHFRLELERQFKNQKPV